MTSNAKITAEGVSAPQSLTLKTSNAVIRVSKLDSPAISLTTSNAGIKGSLPGRMEDYAIKSGTSNGKNSLPNERAGGSKTLNVKTSNANISLEFDGEPGELEALSIPLHSSEKSTRRNSRNGIHAGKQGVPEQQVQRTRMQQFRVDALDGIHHIRIPYVRCLLIFRISSDALPE